MQAATGYREVTLKDIYAALPQSLFAADFGREAQISAELSCERRMLVADTEIAALMRAAKAAGAQVILVSDTYFKAAEVKDSLAAAGCGDLPIDRLYVSCEAGKPKYRGLFDTVLKDAGVPAAAMAYVGDSHEADIAPCAARAIKTVHYDKWAFGPRVQKIEFPLEVATRVALLGRCGDLARRVCRRGCSSVPRVTSQKPTRPIGKLTPASSGRCSRASHAELWACARSAGSAKSSVSCAKATFWGRSLQPQHATMAPPANRGTMAVAPRRD